MVLLPAPGKPDCHQWKEHTIIWKFCKTTDKAVIMPAGGPGPYLLPLCVMFIRKACQEQAKMELAGASLTKPSWPAAMPSSISVMAMNPLVSSISISGRTNHHGRTIYTCRSGNLSGQGTTVQHCQQGNNVFQKACLRNP